MTLHSHSWAYIWKKQTNKHNLNGYMHPNVHCSTLYNNQDVEAT